MKQISARPTPARAAVIVPLDSKRGQLYTSRLAYISKMSGYPSAIHSIGRLQRSINLSSFRELLTSLHRVSSLSYITAEVIESMDGTKIDKYQLDRTEIATYVTNIISSNPTFKATDVEIDLISQLITSFEANPDAWMLQGANQSEDLHVQIQRLYREVLISTPDDKLPVFTPNGEIVNFSQLPSFVGIQKAAKAKKANKSEENDIAASADLAHEYTKYRFACVRVIDHIYQLMMDRDAWYSFVAPRMKADVTNNLERAKSLRLLAVYTHSLLTYYQFFSLEMFMKSYQLVQTWILHFPPLDVVTTANLEGILRKYDLLDAKGDVEALIGSFSNSAETDIKAMVFPQEFISKFGLSSAVERISQETSKYALSGSLSELSELSRAHYLPLISGVAASSFDITYKLSQMILIDKIVAEEVRKALAVLLPSLTGSTAETTLSRFRSLNIRASMPFTIPHAASWEVEAGTEKGIKDGTLRLDSASPGFTYDYHEYVRDHLNFKMTTDKLISTSYPNFFPQQLIDYDRAEDMRKILKYNWKTLVPDYMGNGATPYSFKSISATPSSVKQLLEDMSGINYEIVIKEMSLPHLREMWATFISSFGLLYCNQQALESGGVNDKNVIVPMDDFGLYDLVLGHGHPYGVTYTALEGMQGKLTKDTSLINLGYGVYLRLLSKIPVVTDDLRRDIEFFSQYPAMYFAAGEGSVPVQSWVMGDGMSNFALFPNGTATSVPSVKFTPKYAYLTQQLFISTDLYFRPSVSAKTRENYTITIHDNTWNNDKKQFFLEYRNIGPYLKPVGSVPHLDDISVLNEAVTKIEQAITSDIKEAADQVDQAGVASTVLSKKVTAELKDASESSISPEKEEGKSYI